MPEQIDEETYRRAEETAAKILSRRPLSAAMLEKKLLEKNFPLEAVEYAVERMRIVRAVDDRAYAELVIRSFTRKGYGALRIRQELQVRGVAKDIPAEMLAQWEPDWDKMLILLERKLRGDVSDRREREKAMAALQRRGFTYPEIRTAMEKYRAELKEEETNI